jgi:uncharacterized protein (DUF1800 family)
MRFIDQAQQHRALTFKPICRSFLVKRIVRLTPVAMLVIATTCVPPAYAQLAADRDGDGLPDTLEAIWGRAPDVKDNDVFGSPSLFVMQQYRDFLVRETDAAGLTYWADRIRQGAATREQLVETFVRSSEFDARIAPVTRLYFAYFNRMPDLDGLRYWGGQAAAGTPLNAISQAFAASPEFVQTYGTLTNTAFVQRVYQNILGRPSDAAGLAYWRGELDAARLSRGALMVAFSESVEYRNKIGPTVLVTMMYASLLQRVPDDAGLQFWSGEIARGVSLQSLITPFLASAEYRTRFLGTNPDARAMALQQDAARFLAQASFGARSEDIAKVRDLGVPRYLDEQLTLPVTGYRAYAYYPTTQAADCRNDGNATSAASLCARDNYSMFAIQNEFFRNALSAPDQLRQRVAFALSQIMVTSGLEVTMAYGMRHYQQLLLDQSFGNFRTLLDKVTRSPNMGRYLDMVNNSKAYTVGSGASAVTIQPNENFARELLQLFAWGVWELNKDGTYKIDGAGNPIPSYENETVREYARALTGWTYAPRPGVTSRWTNATNYEGDMVPDPNTDRTRNQHDFTAKTLSAQSACAPGVAKAVLPANQTPEQDLQDTITNIFCHPNVGPFIVRQLIQHLVTSNPSPAYVQRVVNVFDNNGQGVRGDMRATVRAILLDSEARGATRVAGTAGKLKEPALLVTSFVRQLGGFSDGLYLRQQATGMGQNVFNSPSVFNYYPAEYVIPATDLEGPQFGILNGTTSFARTNFLHSMTFANTNSGNPDAALAGAIGTKIDLTRWTPLANNPTALVEAVAAALIPGQLTPQLRDAIVPAVNAIAVAATNGPLDRARTAIYLVAASPQFQVDR